MPRKVLSANRQADSYHARTGQFPEVTISSQTEIGQTEESIMVPKQWAYTGREPVISSSLADTPCSRLGIQGLLDLLNSTLRTSYTLNTSSLSSVLKDCIAKNYDFGTAYGHLRSAWCHQPWCTIQMKLRKLEAEDIKLQRTAVKGSQIVNPDMRPQRVWDLYSNCVVPWWSCRLAFWTSSQERPQPISYAWVEEVDHVGVLTPINGRGWPVPIPKGANLDLIHIEMLNLGMEYTWLDVLCLRQRGGKREDLRVEEWKLDVPTIGATYKDAEVVCYLSGLGLPLSLKEGDLESDRCWFRRAWTVQEVGNRRIIAGNTPDGPLDVKPIDGTGNYEDEKLTKFHQQLKSATVIPPYDVFGPLSAMQDQISTNPVDKVAGLAFSLQTRSIPAYYETQSLEDAWTALTNEMHPIYPGLLFFTYPEPGTGCKKWRPSWEQVMTKPLPKDSLNLDTYVSWAGGDWCRGLHIERGFVRGLAVGGEEGIGRYGELVVEDARGIAHTFNILANHRYQIPEETYTLLGCNLASRASKICLPQYWVVGKRLPPSERFEKVSVFTMNDLDEIKRLMKLGLSAKSHKLR